MMVVLLGAGIGFALAGLLAIGFGIPVNEFSFGNTLILAGAIALCTGAILCGIWIAVRELKLVARQLGIEPRPQPAMADTGPAGPSTDGSGFQFDAGAEAGGHQPAAAGSSVPPPPPWLEELGSRPRSDAPPPEPVEAPPPVKPRRNLLFSSSSRKERERAQARAVDPSVLDSVPEPVVPPLPSEAAEPPPANFDDAWPKPERARGSDVPPQRRAGNRTPSTFNDASAPDPAAGRAPPLVRKEEPPPVTVLKSGVVDGMAYSLYSDGSIEAQMPEGMMRFASIDDLRAHLDQRP